MELVSAARSLLNVRFAYMGRSPAGVDCAGLILFARYKAMGERMTCPPYPRRPKPEHIRFLLERFAAPIPGNEAAAGDIVLLGLAHVGLFSGRTVIHAEETRGRVYETPMDVLKRARVDMHWYRLKGVPAWPS